MLRQIYIDRFNKIVSSFKPELFGTLRVIDSRPYSQTVEQYLGTPTFIQLLISKINTISSISPSAHFSLSSTKYHSFNVRLNYCCSPRSATPLLYRNTLMKIFTRHYLQRKASSNTLISMERRRSRRDRSLKVSEQV